MSKAPPGPNRRGATRLLVRDGVERPRRERGNDMNALRIATVTAGTVAGVLLATGAASASTEAVKVPLTCEGVSGVTGEVLTLGPAAACYSTGFGSNCVAYTHRETSSSTTSTCYVPF